MKIKTTSFSLKILAFILMTLDHVGYFFSDIDITLYYVFRILGRLAMPLFCFCMAEGYKNSKSRQKYLLRLIGAAFVSEIPFNLCFSGKLFYLGSLNVMFTFSIALASLMLGDIIEKTKYRILFFVPFVVGFFAAELLDTDYGGYGVALVMLFCFSSKFKLKPLLDAASLLLFSLRSVGIFVLKYALHLVGLTGRPNLFVWGALQIFAFFAIIPILLYNGERGPRFKSERISASLRYCMYLFYPVHMLIIWIVFKIF